MNSQSRAPSADSVFSRRVRLYSAIRRGILDESIISELLPNGEPHLYERQLWDYKLEAPSPLRMGSTDAERESHDAKMAELIKDAVAFYNTHGGYIVLGIRNEPRVVEGFFGAFDCDDFNKRILGATKHQVDCHYRAFETAISEGSTQVGLIFIPQRPDSVEPAQFLKDAPKGGRSVAAYRRSQIYFRQSDSCRPAETSQDFSFLCAQGRRRLDEQSQTSVSSVEHNLGPNESGFPRFIGREDHLSSLWRWLSDRFNPVKLLAGLGGVGKTSIAREFAEAVVSSAPSGVSKVIWLSAKREFYTAIRGKYIPLTKVDFSDADGLLRSLLLELGSPAEQISKDWTREDLVEEVISHLRELPSVLVVDDLDSLTPDDQQDSFHTLIHVIGQTLGGTNKPSRALVTARLDLGASPSQLIRVSGMNFDDFSAFTSMVAESIEMPWTLGREAKLLKRFHRVTGGSPTFVASIIRLVDLGEPLEQALHKWEGSDGDAVRRFAFEKELNTLTDSQLRTLFAACMLGETSLIQLEAVTESNETRLRDDIGALRKFHLLGSGEDVPGGRTLMVPGTIRLMKDILQGKIRDPKRIEEACARSQRGSEASTAELGLKIQRVISFWLSERNDEALEAAMWIDRQHPNDPDIKCLVGRAYLKFGSSHADHADKALRRASELRCERKELLPMWVEAKGLTQDWIGLLEISATDKAGPASADLLVQRSVAYQQLAAQALKIGDLRTAASHYLAGGKEIDESFRTQRAGGRVVELKDLRGAFFQSHIELVDQLTKSPNEYIETWFAVADGFDAYVRRPYQVKLGVSRLLTWWRAVEDRGAPDRRGANLAEVQARRLLTMVLSMKRMQYPDAGLIEVVQAAADSLFTAIASFRERHRIG